MKKLHILLLTALAISVNACKDKSFGEKPEWPVSGTDHIDTEWFTPELANSDIRYSDPDIMLTYKSGGIIYSASTNPSECRRMVELSTGTEVIFSYTDIDEKTDRLLNPSLSVNGTELSLRQAKLEKKESGKLWISMSTDKKEHIILVVEE